MGDLSISVYELTSVMVTPTVVAVVSPSIMPAMPVSIRSRRRITAVGIFAIMPETASEIRDLVKNPGQCGTHPVTKIALPVHVVSAVHDQTHYRER
jgi:hypothetical protein